MAFVHFGLSFAHAAEYDRRQRIQHSRMLYKKERIIDRQYGNPQNRILIPHKSSIDGFIQITGVRKPPKTIPQFILFCLLTTYAIQGVAGDTPKVPSTSGPQNLHSGSYSAAVAEKQCLNGYCTSLTPQAETLHPSLAASNPLTPAQLSGETVSALATIFCETNKNCISVSGSEVTFTGQGVKCQDFVNQLNDYESLRTKVVPVSPLIGKTKVHPGPHFENWLQAQKALGIDPEGVKNVAYTELDCNSSDIQRTNPHVVQAADTLCDENKETRGIALKYETASDGTKSFNQLTADAFIERLKKESLFFAYATSQNNNIIYSKNGYIIIDYHKLEPYLASVEFPINFQDENNCWVTFELQTALQRTMAASGGPISLEATSNPKKFRVRTVTLGDLLSLEEKKSRPPTLEIIIDKSGSMSGAPIHTINSKIPVLLKSIQEKLSEKDLFNVKIYKLNDMFVLHREHTITAHSSQPTWDPLSADGGTNLKPIGRQMKIEEGENPNKILIAFTDGEHMDSYDPLDSLYYEELKELQGSGKFSQLYLCRFGAAQTNPEHFFERFSQIFKGSSSVESDAQKCIDQLAQAIPSLLTARQPVILTINGKNDVHWIQVGSAGITTLAQSVQNNDVITHGSFKATVQLPETKEEKIARLKAALEELEAKK